MEPVFRALADPTRRQLLDRLYAHNGQTLGELCDGLGMTRQAATQHLALLEAANLISTVRRGRTKLHYLNPVPLHDIGERWIGKFELSSTAHLERSPTQSGARHERPTHLRLRDLHREQRRTRVGRADRPRPDG